MNYVFYDTETTGLETRFDQILQFVAAYVDEDLVIRDSFDLRSRRMAQVLPSVYSLLVNGLKPDDLEKAPYSHYAMVREVHRRFLEWSPAIFIGYNSISFDEELLRSALYQSLHQPYVTNTKGNQRADILKIMHALYILMPSALNVSLNEKGKPSFKLIDLARENQLEHEVPHEAFSDVTATLALARLVRGQAPHIWERGLQVGKKDFVVQLLNKHKVLLWVGYPGKSQLRWITYLGKNSKQPNNVVVFDLSFDPMAYTPGKKFPGFLEFKINAQPFLVEPEWVEKYQGKEVSFELTERANWISAHPEFVAKALKEMSEASEEYEKSAQIEDRIYDGFASNEDARAMERFHEVSWEERLAICQGFSDKRYQELGLRLILAENPAALPLEEQTRLRKIFAERLNKADETPWRTFAKVFKEIEEARKDSNWTPEQQQQLDLISDYFEALRSEFK